MAGRVWQAEYDRYVTGEWRMWRIKEITQLKVNVCDGECDGACDGMWRESNVFEAHPVYMADWHAAVILLRVNEVHFPIHYKGVSPLKFASYAIMEISKLFQYFVMRQS